MTTYTLTAEQLQQLLACVKSMYDYAGCRVHMQSYADQSADSLALLGKLQPNTQEPVATVKLTTDGFKYLDWHAKHWTHVLDAGVKLYTHPAPQQKPLTDEQLRKAAQAVVDRWDTPLWKDVPATAEYINKLREALK